MDGAGVDILRPVGTDALISARTFEHGFVGGLGQHLRIQTLGARAWLDALFAGEPGGIDASARRFADTTKHADFLCPAPEALAWSPELLRLRNRSGARVRVLLIAHAPGVFVPEWALLAPLMQPGDRIIAPTQNAAAVIRLLCPSLMPHVRVVSHPIPPWIEPWIEPRSRTDDKPPRLVSLGRLVRDKLIHREIEAVDILRRRGLTVRLELAGPLAELGSEGPSAYVRSLQAKIRRLGLERQVALIGTLEDPAAKLAFVGGAAALLNLSVSLEESFGKSIAEALSCGVPCLVTRWGGLHETLGAGGRALPVTAHEFGVDLDAEPLADAIEAMLSAPPTAEACYEQSRHAHPERVAARYRAVLDEARDEFAQAGEASPLDPDQGAAPTQGLLAVTAPLTCLSWTEAMELHQREVSEIPDLRGLAQPGLLSPGAQLRGLMCLAVRSAVQQVQAGLPVEDWLVASGPEPAANSERTEFLDRCALTVTQRGTRSSRVIVLDLLQRLGHHDAVARGLVQLREEGLDSPGLRYIEIEALLQADGAPEALAALEHTLDLDRLGEHEAHRVQQLARVCHRLGQPERALPALRRWTERFPDSPDAAGVWQQRALLCLSTEAGAAEVREALEHCVELSGPRPELLAVLSLIGEV